MAQFTIDTFGKEVVFYPYRTASIQGIIAEVDFSDDREGLMNLKSELSSEATKKYDVKSKELISVNGVHSDNHTIYAIDGIGYMFNDSTVLIGTKVEVNE